MSGVIQETVGWYPARATLFAGVAKQVNHRAQNVTRFGAVQVRILPPAPLSTSS
jgi:hypothetical protein